jgi:L-threonylcarbamoyladenylate synthase
MELEPLIVALQRPGGVVLYPTETVYGLGGLASDAAAADRIARIKGRPLSPLIVLVDRLPADLGPIANALAKAFWPGPLTLVVSAWEGVTASVCAADGSVAIRQSSHPVAAALVSAVGAITSTSANLAGQLPLRSLDRAHELTTQVDAVFNAGLLPDSAVSTLVDARSGIVLRQGAISEAAIQAVLEA